MFSSLAYNQRKKIVKDAYGLNVKSLEDYISNFFFDFDQNKSFQINTVYQEIDELEIDFCDEFENLRKKMIFEAEIDTMGEEGREGEGDGGKEEEGGGGGGGSSKFTKKK